MRCIRQFYTIHEQICTKIKACKKKIKKMHVNNKHANQTIKHNDQTKTKLSPQGPQQSRHYVARVRRRDDIFHSQMYVYLFGKCGKTRNYCLLSVESRNGSRHLVFWSLGTLTGLKDRVEGLLCKGNVLAPQISLT
jgi:hypothetical protein